MNHLHFHSQLHKLIVVARLLSKFIFCYLRYLVRKTLSVRNGRLFFLCILQRKFASLFFDKLLFELASRLECDGDAKLV